MRTKEKDSIWSICILSKSVQIDFPPSLPVRSFPNIFLNKFGDFSQRSLLELQYYSMLLSTVSTEISLIEPLEIVFFTGYPGVSSIQLLLEVSSQRLFQIFCSHIVFQSLSRYEFLVPRAPSLIGPFRFIRFLFFFVFP